MRDCVIFIFCFVLFFVCVLGAYVFADVYVTIDKETDAVVDVSQAKDVVLEKDWKRIKLDGDLVNYPLQYHPEYYFYKDDIFVVNIKKLSDEANAQDIAVARIEEMRKIKNKAYLMAKSQCEKDGVSFQYITDGDFE